VVNARSEKINGLGDFSALDLGDETHLKRLKRLEIYWIWKFLSPGVSVSTAGHISREISRH
jgi:hypothetical protein